jgi:hypothetical protein
MAARRLVIVMLVLLFVSTLAAALVPAPEGDEEETSTPIEPAAGRPSARTVVQTIDADARRPKPIRLSRGDRLVLTVRSPRPTQVEIGGLGQLEDADPESPARFDLLLDEPGEYGIRLVRPPETIGRIVVEKPSEDLSGSRRRAGRSGDTSRSR